MADDDALQTVRTVRELVNDWPLDVAGTIRELFTPEDHAVLQVLIEVTRERIGSREYPKIT